MKKYETDQFEDHSPEFVFFDLSLLDSAQAQQQTCCRADDTLQALAGSGNKSEAMEIMGMCIRAGLA